MLFEHPTLFDPKDHFSFKDAVFRRLGIIGKGGSSKVFRVMVVQKGHYTRLDHGKIYALKCVDLSDQDATIAEGYLNEVELLARLRNDPRIIRLEDYYLDKEQKMLQMVLQYGEIDFNSLLKKQPRWPLSLNFIRMQWEQMLEAVQTIHEQNIVHSDLKPANFLVVEGSLKLIDFGIARAIPDFTTNVRRDHLAGTANYMSPEAFVATDESGETYKLGRSSDVWSLGCILYQLVYGRPPFDHLSRAQRFVAITDATYEIQYPTIESMDRFVLKACTDEIRKCLQKDPKKRPAIPALLESSFLHPERYCGIV
ncbi:kinase-like domain-containing protein [Cladochytrium replicatum]|nr:kinase-like domain-containing protein [Cladochytrium replicatum]